jgi:hypothetical protein
MLEDGPEEMKIDDEKNRQPFRDIQPLKSFHRRRKEKQEFED